MSPFIGQCCGTCKHFVRSIEKPELGDCHCPIPHAVTPADHHVMHQSKGTNCAAYKPKRTIS